MSRPYSSPAGIVRIAVLFEGALVLLALALGWWMQPRPHERIAIDVRGTALGLFATLPLLLVLWGSRQLPFGPLRRLKIVVDRLVVPLFSACRLWQLALISALAGLGEELLFRGVIQPAIAGWSSLLIAVLLTSLLFGLLHALTITYAVLAFLISLYLGWLSEATGNLWAPIVAHAVYDFLALVWLVRWRSEDPEAPPTGAP